MSDMDQIDIVKRVEDEIQNAPIAGDHARELISSLLLEIKDMEALLSEASAVFNKQSIKGLTAYITEKLLSKFTPAYTAFIFHENLSSETPEILCFQDKHPIDNMLRIPSIEPYKHFFSLSPTSVDFRVFEYMVGKPELTDVFKPLNPEKVIPIMGFDGVHGFIVIGKKFNGEAYSVHEIKYLDRLIQFVSISFRNNIHYKRAITDFKTKLFNHSYFILRLEEELARVRRYRTQMSLLILDVDFFKKLNDAHGHVAGDKVLEAISQVLLNSIRTEDVAARFGGEEFVVMLIQCNLNFGWLVAERIRQRIEQTVVRFEEKNLSVTVSIGVAFTSTEVTVPDTGTLLKMADVALYHSKKIGRNRTSIFRESLLEKRDTD